MDSEPFANRIIKQFIDHLLGGEPEPKDWDLSLIRVVFRSLGGSWQAIYGGDIDQTTLLEKVVTNWGAYKKNA